MSSATKRKRSSEKDGEEKTSSKQKADETKGPEKVHKEGELCHFELPAHDMKRVCKFYTDTFNWKCQPWQPNYALWEAPAGNRGGFFHSTNDIPVERFTTLVLYVEDMANSCVRLVAAGGVMVQPRTLIAPGIGCCAYFLDTEGNQVGLWNKDEKNLVENGKAIDQRVILPMTAHDFYENMMDSAKHSKFTGSKCNVERSVRGAFSLYDGYISGRNIQLLADKKIVQSWRGVDWPNGHWSHVTFDIDSHPTGCQVTLRQTGWPASARAEGWQTFYWSKLGATSPPASSSSSAS